MKIKNVINALPSLQKLAGQDLSIKKLYKISKLMGNLENEIAFYDTQRQKICAQYCDTVGNQYVPKSKEDEAELNAKMNELLNTDIDDVQSVVIGLNDDVKLSYNDLIALEGLVVIEGDE